MSYTPFCKCNDIALEKQILLNTGFGANKVEGMMSRTALVLRKTRRKQGLHTQKCKATHLATVSESDS